MENLSQNLRLFLATVLSVCIILLWDHFFVKPVVEYQELTNNPVSEITVQPSLQKSNIVEKFSKEESISNKNERVQIGNTKVRGTINLRGARIDDLVLSNYRSALDEASPKIDLLSPSNTKDVYFAEFGWVKSGDEIIDMPNSKTLWHADKKSICANETITLSWTNPQNILFKIELTLDQNYMFSVKQFVTNHSHMNVALSPYALITKTQTASENQNVLIHEGPIGVFDQKLQEVEFEKLKTSQKMEFNGKTSWIGFSDKYWLTALVPDKSKDISSKFMHFQQNGADHYQVSYLVHPKEIAPNTTAENKLHFFGGAKEIDLLDQYQENLNIDLFDRAVDFGILYMITKPLLLVLHFFNSFLGNFGVSILLLTVCVKLLLFPLAHKGYKGMNKLKELQPKMLALKERYKDDAMQFQKALIEMYRKEKVNPMGGCLPILLQIPVFFALYKVLYVSIEMRHAPFFGWIKDLSVPDPTTIFNLFGLIPWDPPQLLMIGVFPMLMALTMYIQQRLNPEPTDPAQAKVMRLLPLIFLFMFSSFPAGLVIYWAWSNFLSIAQQIAIKKMTGQPVTFHKRAKK